MTLNPDRQPVALRTPTGWRTVRRIVEVAGDFNPHDPQHPERVLEVTFELPKDGDRLRSDWLIHAMPLYLAPTETVEASPVVGAPCGCRTVERDRTVLNACHAHAMPHGAAPAKPDRDATPLQRVG